jgi:predicted GH43/DUF377 family glycosyl hydrolase
MSLYLADFKYSKIKNPVFSLDGLHARDPAVIIRDNLAYIFFTLFNPEQGTWHVAMTTTRDFIRYSSFSIVSPEGYASPGNIIRFRDKWVLCYQQYRSFPHYICLSYSEDLINWSVPEKVFNSGAGNTWNTDGRVIDPYIVQSGGVFYCFYTGSGRWLKSSGHNLLGLAVSKDLVRWKDKTTDSPLFGVEHEWEKPDGNENNCVIYDKTRKKWIMLYSCSLVNQKIAYCESTDLVNWTGRTLCRVPVFPQVSIFGAPFIIEELSENGLWTMIYQGTGKDRHVSFYMLQSNDLINWHI